MDIFIAFIVGVLIGGIVGVLVMAWLIAGKGD